MANSSVLRVAPGADGVSIWSSEIFGDDDSRVREFLSRTFAVREVEGVELQRSTSFGRIRYGAVASPAEIWKKLSRALTGSLSDVHDAAPSTKPLDTRLLYLDAPGAKSVRVSRVGDALSTWRVRDSSETTLRLWHPVLRNRRDVVFRLEEELAAILGVEDFRASALTAAVSIRFDKRALTPERLARELEKAWPRLLDGLDGPPSRTRFFAAGGLLGLAYTGQFLVPALRPVAVAGAALYSSPNLFNAAKQLTRGEVGISALYATGLGFMLFTGMPFTSSVMAVLMQMWPHLTRRKLVVTQRRLFAGPRRRPVWARISRTNGHHHEVEVSADELRAGDLIVVRSGEVVPVDGVIESGAAAIIDDLFGAEHTEDRSQGDRIAAGTFVRDGSLTIRVERAGTQTSASFVASLLPHAVITGLPSSYEAERIANRNAKPALAASALSLLLTRTLRPSQALIRPDYATAPRLSAQLSTLHALAHGLQRGVLFKTPAALDLLADADVYVIDDTAGLERRRVEVASVQSVSGVSVELVASYALAAQRKSRSERTRALATFLSKRKTVQAKAQSTERQAGVTRYRDKHGSAIEVATTQYLLAAKIAPRFQIAPSRGPDTEAQQPLRPIWVLRDGEVIGVVSFERNGPIIGAHVVAGLKTQNKRARIIYLSRGAKAEAEALASKLGIELARGGLSQAAKAELIRGLGRKTVWIGNGSDPFARDSIAASTVSVSVASLAHAREDAADILLPLSGLDSLVELVGLGRAHAARLENDYRTVYAVNLLGVAGAFLARFGSLQAGLLSNVGTGVIYARHARSLSKLASTAEKERSRTRVGIVR